jgi:hypothetical protein
MMAGLPAVRSPRNGEDPAGQSGGQPAGRQLPQGNIDYYKNIISGLWRNILNFVMKE